MFENIVQVLYFLIRNEGIFRLQRKIMPQRSDRKTYNIFHQILIRVPSFIIRPAIAELQEFKNIHSGKFL